MILPLRDTVVYPGMFVPLAVGQDRSIRLVDEAVVGNRLVGLVAQYDEEVVEAGPGDVYEIGTAAVIHRLLKVPDGTVRLVVQGVERFRVLEFTQTEPYLIARVQPILDVVENTVEVQALMRNVVDLFQRMVSLVAYMPDELVMAAINIEDPRQLVYLIATSLRVKTEDKQEILELDRVADKLKKLTTILNQELEVLELGRKIQSQAQDEMQKMQREYFLREQMKAIQQELGEDDEQAIEARELEEKIVAAGMPEEAEKEARRELDRLRKLPTAAAEYGVIRTYLDWLVSLPWNQSTTDQLEIGRAREILDEDHYDLEKVKDRILEYLAVRKLKQERKAEQGDEVETEPGDLIRREREGVILCFVGPPGTGKTSLGQSIARALGRKFVRMSLGGMRDEAEIRGHRRTYIGSMPGRIIQALRRCESRNPIFMLDEVDKIGMDFRGDPASALLEVLDPEQNRDFRDHYLDVPFDLSQVMFITTANLLDPIPAPLRDRMEVLFLSGYTEEEKVKIAQQYLIPRQIRENALTGTEVEFTPEGLQAIIRDYTREAGLRNMEREIGTICRKMATQVAEGKLGDSPVVIQPDMIHEYLGKPRFYFEAAERTEVPGVATGLSWTQTGGDILFIEATRMKGKKGLTLTGQLGDVMRESAQAALSYVRSKAAELGIAEDFFEESDLHVHVPAGAVPKDGPSAGVTIATAMVSLLTSRPVRSNVGMTGEITLRGRVLPIGGLKEKVLAARRAGLDTVILPRWNAKDLEELPEEIQSEMQFVLVDTVDQVFDAALAAPES
ncbi:MAG: endopeptidase La [Chloroflexi bacterium]|nr:endopeptidase La [Chloroflexota bacterium]MBU1751420.1 endopeptidase La [Chloroflexota bacterium]